MRIFALVFCLAIHLSLICGSFADSDSTFTLGTRYYPAEMTSAVSSGIVLHRNTDTYGPVPVPKGHPIDKIASLMAKLEWDQVDPFYGAALPLLVTEDRIFFVHNYHELPRSRAKWAHLRASGKWSGFIPQAAHVAGYHAGYDIAVSWVGQKFSPEQVESLNKRIRNMYYTGDLERGLWRVGVLGIPGPWRDPRQVFKNILWAAEADMLSVWEDTSEEVTVAELFGPSRTKIPIELRQDCPPVFLVGCYRVPMRTWGYSGGAFIVGDVTRADDGTHFISPKIAGIPSHFVPLTESTYIIPARTVLMLGFDIAKEYVKQTQAGDPDPLVVRDLDLSGSFRIEDEHSLTALNGPLAGQRFYSTQSPFAPGGGESSGGGGESSGGGGESSGGGGESSGGGGPIVAGKDYYFISDTLGNVAGLVNYEQLEKEVENPSSWQKRETMVNGLLGLIRGTKGVDAIIRHRHGIFTGEKKRVYRIADRPVANLHDFFMNYRFANSENSLESHFTDNPMPVALELYRNDTPGIFGDLYLFKFKPSNQLDPRVFHPSVAQFNQINAPELASLLLHNMWNGTIADKKVDAVSIREWISPGGSVSAARFEVVNQKLKVTAIIPRFARVEMDFPGTFQAKGTSFFQYVGGIDYCDGTGVKYRLHGVANLEWDRHSNRWEFKIVMAGKVPVEKVQTKDPISPEAHLFSNSEEIAFIVFSLPLRVPANETLAEIETKPWELEQMEIGYKRESDLKRKRQAGFQAAWAAAEKPAVGIVSAIAKAPVDLELARSMKDYLTAFDQKFDSEYLTGLATGAVAQIARGDVGLKQDLAGRLKAAEKRMGLQVGNVFKDGYRLTPRQLAVRVQMLEQQQMMRESFSIESLSHTDLAEAAKKAMQRSSNILNGARRTVLPYSEEIGSVTGGIIRAFGPMIFDERPKLP